MFTKSIFNNLKSLVKTILKIPTIPDIIKNKSNYTLPLDLHNFKELINYIYQTNQRSGFVCGLDKTDPDLIKQHVFLTYGEILPEGVARLLNFLNPTTEDSFVDLGSGAGKVILQSFLCSPIKYNYGIEIDPKRHQAAIDSLVDIRALYPQFFQDNNKQIDFINKNIKDFDFSTVSILLCNATCFSGGLINFILNKIYQYSQIRAVMSTQKMPELEINNLFSEQVAKIETSWHIPPDKSNCFIYLRNKN